jgi:hypothetical protein
MRAGDVGRDYSGGIRRAYCGELSASRVYRLLAKQEKYAEQRLKLSAIADVESQTVRVLEPIAMRLGITCGTGAIEEIVHRRVAELGALSWTQFIEQALVNWPPYIAEYDALAEYSPQLDRSAMRLLVAHERALVEFLHLERAQPHALASIDPLRNYLKEAADYATFHSKRNV